LSGAIPVRITDYDKLDDFVYYQNLSSVIDQAGINPKDYKSGKFLLTDAKVKEIRENIIKVGEVQAKKEKALLQKKMAKVDLKREQDLADINDFGIESYAEEIAEDIVNRVQGLDRVSPEYNFDVAKRGPMKEQKWLIRDDKIEKFLVNDAAEVMKRYVRTMGTDIELTKKFGSAKLEDVIAPITREYTEQRALIKDKKGREQLKNSYETDKANIEAVHQILKGTYAGNLYGGADTWYKKLGRMTLSYNYIRMLGGVVASSIPDISKIIAYNGFGKAFTDGFIPASKMLPDLIKRNRPALTKELKLAGITTEHYTNAAALSMADMFNRSGNRGAFENFVDSSVNVFSKINGIVYWNNFVQSIGGVMSQKRMLQNILDLMDGIDIGKKEKSYLAALGIGKNEYKKIGELLKKHSTKDKDGFIFANTEKWNDRDASKLFRTALKRDVDSILLRKDIGDVPMFANSGIGKVILQFKSFMFASTLKTLMTGLQIRDAAQLQGLAAMISLGSLTYVLKTLESGREPDYSPENLLVQGIDRSGVLGVFMEINNIYEKIGGYGIGKLSGTQSASRYGSRSLDEALLGPSLGTISNLGRAHFNIMSEDNMSDSDRRNIRKLIPFNNLTGISTLARSIDDGVAKKLGY
jgi:hypothetical protein